MVGTLMLMLPIAKAGPGGASFIEALFTATSAVCVTGHIIVDTPVFWSGFGQVVILVLIQVGGLGIMIFATLLGMTLARKLTIRSRITASTETRAVGFADAGTQILSIVKVTLLIEAVVFVLLTLRFWLGLGESIGDAAWYGVFHAVSSFNNAGFSTFSDNMVGFVGDPWICLPIAASIILGGLGFPVLMQLRREFRTPLHWTMNTKLVLVGSGVLLVAGTVLTCLIEWSNPATLGELSPAERILAGFFHSVQTRTAGFNSLPLGEMNPETWLVSDVLMFIGGGPAGTAGGIKVTTFLVLFFIMYTEVRGEGAVNIFGKRLSRAVHRQAITVVLISVAAVMAGTGGIMLLTDYDIDRVLFEVISAFGTVGLSTGITADLPAAAQLILVVLMFLGRIGPLTLGTAIALRQRRILYELPKERPVVG
ncbi:TrkH family potassium uptake protein [Diaminobutyricimonas sp. LJ205]|uniref:TrkH family potassium uptake protein n=1 Tax=Diaminobutyricimonas sp. LJ205 TaxID=2683590 RepID=UPI0012F47CA3|nr:potassium transporter TrkG [Diaminobutyricimonas sp. LJ205]